MSTYPKFLHSLTTLDDDLHYEEDTWEDQTSHQEAQGEVEVFHSEWLNMLNLFFSFVKFAYI